MELPDLTGHLVVVDTETSGLFVDDGARLSVVSLAWEHDGHTEAIALPYDQGTRDKLPSTELDFSGDPNLGEQEWRTLLSWLENQRLVFHNAKFDLHHLRTGTRHWAGRDLVESCVWDTMLAQKELDPRESAGLKETAARLSLQGGGERDTEAELKARLRAGKIPTGRYDLLPWDEIRDYAKADAELTLALWKVQQQRIEQGEGSLERIEFKLSVMKALYKMEQRGIGYDHASSLAAAAELEARAQAIRAKLPFRPTNPAAKQYFFVEQGEIPIKQTKSGAPSLDDETLQGIAERGNKAAADYLELTKITRAISMWYRGYPQAAGSDGRLRTSFNQLKVRSGRMSAERVQLHAIPKADKTLQGVPGVRELVQAKEGHRLWNLDLGQAELRVATKYAQCRRMREMLEEGVDMHGETCQAIFGIGRDHPDWKTKRDIAKRLNFGGIFQIGPRTFQATLSKQAGLKWPLRDCEAAVAEWRRTYPEFGVAYRRAENLARARQWVKIMPNTRFEDRSWFGPLDFPNTAWNRMVQGSLALYNLIWLVETEKLWPGALVLNVHDSQLLELPEGDDAEVARKVAERGAELATSLFKIKMTVDYEPWAK